MTTTTAQPLTTAVRTEQLTKIYGQGDTRVVALDHVSVDFWRGEFTAIMGPSGSGKSTLMHCAAGLDTPTEGRVLIGQVDATALNDKSLTLLRRRRVGFIFQSFNLLPTMTARENILLPLKLARTKPDQSWFDTVIGVLGLTERLHHRPGELSGGQSQRVAAARALITRPDVIFADEPTGALDSASSDELLDFLARCVHELGQTIVMVTHDAHVAGYADRLLQLADGRIIADKRLHETTGRSPLSPEPGRRLPGQPIRER
ncbi:ABC transporter ATP-binding protein [Propionibacterium australiense]|uniref:ABC transporter-like n=1 Tax=Propionibacterium australiense TaxID=119981 RepID=A0A383S5B7_9ACTN|nr:ABC transporter ATP-binding protein [Propionibacterium australiense]RLP08184.1 ATP-binding cassette domain-containing protein [Propionibacterium australiense]RLP08288.1 ATP-binding cassette domain-containing protein [Propionibacterium australiense]SYZ33097.1 ABC transporter-like [Propionibacterium australiense]VEH89114.1 Macrolide export ATP-binding/permease protein MacB [Propionibacterium australiense]